MTTSGELLTQLALLFLLLVLAGLVGAAQIVARCIDDRVDDDAR